jgi:metal-sulfur cluster biosynthetic enzyme/ribosomal protein L22
MTTLTEAAGIALAEKQLRVSEADASAALARVMGQPASQARNVLRSGAGRTCEPVARMLDKALIRAQDSGLMTDSLMLISGSAIAAEDIVRVRRKAHGVADWISSPTSDVTIVLQPKGLSELPPMPAAVGCAPEPEPTPASPETEAELAVREALYDVIDPDLGVNIVDLGFIRRIHVDDDGRAIITMTLTSAACPLTMVMESQIRSVLSDAGTDFEVQWEWLPSWRPKDITDDGRDQLRAIGFSSF